MKYTNSNIEIQLYDFVALEGAMKGIIVCIFGEKKFAEKFPETEWGIYNHGVLVDSLEAGLIMYENTDSLVFIKRSQ